MKSLFERIRELREEKDLSQIELAKLLHFSRQQMSRFENGTTKLAPETIVRIADFFNVSADYLLGRTNKRNFEYKIATGGLKSKLTEEEIREIILIVNEVLASKKTDK